MNTPDFSKFWSAIAEDARLIGYWNDLAAYYKKADGTVWQYSRCTGRWTHCGDHAEFVATFKGRRRGFLLPSEQ